MPGTLQLVTVGKVPTRIQSFMVQNAVFMLVNPDILNNIFIGNDPGSQLIAVPPLGSTTLTSDPNHDLWVSTNGGNYTVAAYLMPGGSNWTPSPAQVAAQINALGLAKDTTLQTTNVNTAATVTNTTGVAKDTTVGSVVTNTTGVAKDTSVQTVNTTLGAPSQSVDVKNLTVGGNPGGIPVLRGTINLGNGSAQTIAGAATATLIAATAITKPSFEAIFQLNLPAAAGTVPFCILNVLWQDSNTGLQVGAKSYVLSSGNGPTNVHTYYLSGPCRGNQIVLTITNRDPAQTATLTWAFNQTSHVYSVDRLLMPTYPAAAPNGFGQPAGNPSKGLLFSSSPTIAASGTIARLSAPSNAKVKVSIDNGAQANGCAVVFLTPSTVGLYDEAVINQSLFRLVAAAGAQANQEWQMPNGPLNISMINQGASGSITPSITITIMEY